MALLDAAARLLDPLTRQDARYTGLETHFGVIPVKEVAGVDTVQDATLKSVRELQLLVKPGEFLVAGVPESLRYEW